MGQGDLGGTGDGERAFGSVDHKRRGHRRGRLSPGALGDRMSGGIAHDQNRVVLNGEEFFGVASAVGNDPTRLTHEPTTERRAIAAEVDEGSAAVGLPVNQPAPANPPDRATLGVVRRRASVAGAVVNLPDPTDRTFIHQLFRLMDGRLPVGGPIDHQPNPEAGRGRGHLVGERQIGGHGFLFHDVDSPRSRVGDDVNGVAIVRAGDNCLGLALVVELLGGLIDRESGVLLRVIVSKLTVGLGEANDLRLRAIERRGEQSSSMQVGRADEAHAKCLGWHRVLLWVMEAMVSKGPHLCSPSPDGCSDQISLFRLELGTSLS